jgi:hypothetical protein
VDAGHVWEQVHFVYRDQDVPIEQDRELAQSASSQ